MENNDQHKEKENHRKDIAEDKGSQLDTITVDENYPGPKETDIGKAEKPGIKDQEEFDRNTDKS